MPSGMLPGVKVGLAVIVVIASGLAAAPAFADTEDCMRTYQSAQRSRLQS